MCSFLSLSTIQFPLSMPTQSIDFSPSIQLFWGVCLLGVVEFKSDMDFVDHCSRALVKHLNLKRLSFLKHCFSRVMHIRFIENVNISLLGMIDEDG